MYRLVEKKKNELNILSGPIVKSVMIYAIPLIFTSILQLLFNATDIAIVGNLASRFEVASVGATTIVNGLIVSTFIAIGSGVDVICARAYGAKDEGIIKRTVSTAYTVSIIGGVLVTILGEFLSESLLRLTNCPENIFDGALLYMRIYLLGIPAVMFFNFLAGVVRTSGDSKRPFIYLSLSGVINVLLNLILIISTGEPIIGVAVATVASLYSSALFLFVHLVKREDFARLNPLKLEISTEILIRILKYGVPTAISTICFSVSNLFVQSAINSFGDVGISGNTAAATLEGIVFAITGAAFSSTAVFVGQNYGAGNKDRVLEIIKKSRLVWSLISVVALVISIFLGPIVLRLIIPGEEEAIAFGMNRVYFLCGGAVIHALYNVNNGVMNAYGYSLYQMIVNLISICGFRIFWMVFVYGPLDVKTPAMLYAAYPISFTLVLLVNSFFVHYILKRYKDNRLLNM